MSFHYTLMKTHSLLRRDIMARARAELHLTSGQPKVLEALIHHEGQDQKTLAAICEIEPATLGSILLDLQCYEMCRKGVYRMYFITTEENGRRYYERNGLSVIRRFVDYRKDL